MAAAGVWRDAGSIARRLYDGAVSHNGARGWLTASGALSVAAGIVVFAVFVWKIGPAQIWSGIVNVGWMFPVIITLGGLRFLVRAWAWTLCVEPAPRPARSATRSPPCWPATPSATPRPFGPLVGEPAKAALVRQHVADRSRR